MLRTGSLFLLHAVLLVLPFLSFAGTGILEVRSDPSGALISIDNKEAGRTPYQSFETPAGKHRIKAFLSREYPEQVQEVVIDERSPSVVMFKFTKRSRGTFVGREIVSTTMKYRGNVTFASVPTGALVVINGEPIKKPAPIGYTDVEVGRYQVEFLLDGRTLRAGFDVIQGETVKLIADFGAGTVINTSERAKRPHPPAEEQSRTKQVDASVVEQKEAVPEQAVQPPNAGQEPSVQLPAGSLPQPIAGAPPYGELVINVDVRRDLDLAFSDFFDIAFPKVPMESLSGPLFPNETSRAESVFKDNIEYITDDSDDTRRFTARIDFSSRDTTRAEDSARSGMMTVQQGTYDLNISLRRLVENFFSMQKLHDETARETIEIIPGYRLVVEIKSHITAENKLIYLIGRNYEILGKKKSRSAERQAPTASSWLTGAQE